MFAYQSRPKDLDMTIDVKLQVGVGLFKSGDV